MNLFDLVMKNTKILLSPKNMLSTYNQTKVRYHIVTEPVYEDSFELKSEESVIRHGVVTAQNPKVITSDFIYRMSGFGDEAKSFLKELNRVLGKNEPALLYNYKNESTDLEIVSGNPDEVSNRIKSRLQSSKANHAVIRGVNSLWDVSLLKFELAFATVFALMLIVRFVYMKNTQTSALPSNTSKLQKTAAKIVHNGMYACLASIVTSGILIGMLYWANIKSGFAIEFVISVHEFSFTVIYGLIAIHITAALYHRFLQDGVWNSMVPFWKEQTKLD